MVTSAVVPLLASETRAAKLLDLSVSDFRALVEGGHLPRAKDLAGFKRWDVEELRRIARGEAVEGLGDVQW
jgi:hypothetical protein